MNFVIHTPVSVRLQSISFKGDKQPTSKIKVIDVPKKRRQINKNKRIKLSKKETKQYLKVVFTIFILYNII